MAACAACEPIIGTTMTPPHSPAPLVRVPCSELVRKGVVSRDGWRWLSPLPAGNTLVAAHAGDPGEVWLAGAAGTLLHARSGVHAGVDAAALGPPFRADLYAVWTTSPVDVVAVGAGGKALRCDGITWNVEDTGTTNTLRGLWAADPYRVFAVGDHATVLVREANRWRPERVVGVEADLEAVIGFPEVGRYYAVGSSGLVLSRAPEGVWAPIVEPSPPRLRTAWAARPDGIFVAGDGVLARLAPGGEGLSGAGGSGDARYTSIWGTPERLFLAEERGPVWTRVPEGDDVLAPAGEPAPLPLFALAGTSPTDVWRTGGGGAIAHWDGAAWTELGRGPYDDLERIAPTGPDTAVLISARGAVLRWDAGTITPVDGPPGARWSAVAFSPADGEVYVAGEATTGRRAGYVGVLRGATLTVIETLPGTELRALHVRPDGTIVAAGQGTSVTSGRASGKWKVADGPTGAAIERLGADGDGRLYAIDTLGQVHVREAAGGAWRPEALGVGTRVHAIATMPDGRVALSGAGGAVLVGVVHSWTAGKAGDGDLHAIAFGAAGGGSARGATVGAAGEAALFDGTSWARSGTGAGMTLRDVAFDSSGVAWACGDGGAILRLGAAPPPASVSHVLTR